MIQNKYFANITTMCLALDINHGRFDHPDQNALDILDFI